MNKSLFNCLILCLLAAITLSACGGGEAAQPSSGGGNGQGFERPEPPGEYAGKENPVADDAAAAEEGKSTYQVYCASCHGEEGKGDGPAAAALNPKPQDLAGNEEELSDAYIFWRISEGGAMAPFHSTMPSWKSTFSEEQIWQVIAYIRTLDEE